MRDLNLRKQLKSFAKGLIKGAAAVGTGGASVVPGALKNTNVGNLPSMVEVDPTTKNKATGIKATSKKLEGIKATGAKMQYTKKLEKLPATSTNAKPAGVQILAKTPKPEISKVKPTVKKTANNKKVKTKVKTNKRGKVKIKTKIK